MEFVMNNIMWFIFAGIILLMTMIGYYAEKTDFGRNVDDDNKKPKKEKKTKNNKKEEPAGIPVLENIDVEKNIGNNSVIENANPLDEEVTNIENNLDNISLETVNEENNNTDTVTNDNQEVTQLENSQKEDIISEPVIEEVVTDVAEEKKEDVVSEPVSEDVITEIVEEKQEEVVSEPKIEEVTTETVEEEKTEDNVSKTVVEDGKDNETNEVQEELPSMDELMDQTTEDKKVVSEDLKVEENIESVKNEEIPSESVNSEEIKENNIEENVVEEIEELPTEVVEEIQEEVSTESKVDDSHPVEEEVGISEIDAENLPVKIEEPVTVSKNNNSDIPEVSIDEIKEQKDVTVEKPQKKSWFGKKKSKKVDTPVDIGIREADSNEVLENTKEPNNDSNDEDDIWKF